MNNYFLKLGSVFGFISVITTLGVHLIVIPADTFEESVNLYNNTFYLLSRGWIIFHCLTVFISMMGVYMALNSPGNIHARLGVISFSIFSWTEITRMFLSLTYLRNLRQSYVNATDPLIKSILKSDIENFSYVGEALFAVFVLAFALGNLFYGIEFLKKDGFPRFIGYALLIWFLTGMLGLVELFYPIEGVSDFFGVYNITFQPLARGVMAFWLMKQFVKGNSFKENQ